MKIQPIHPNTCSSIVQDLRRMNEKTPTKILKSKSQVWTKSKWEKNHERTHLWVPTIHPFVNSNKTLNPTLSNLWVCLSKKQIEQWSPQKTNKYFFFWKCGCVMCDLVLSGKKNIELIILITNYFAFMGLVTHLATLVCVFFQFFYGNE